MKAGGDRSITRMGCGEEDLGDAAPLKLTSKLVELGNHPL
jgi:hypothetical protein